MPGVNSAKADIALSQSTVWDATMETGATDLNADLSNVPVRSLLFKTGAEHSDDQARSGSVDHRCD